MGMKRSKKALPEVRPPRICVTFRRATFWSRPKNSKMCLSGDRPENSTNTMPGRDDNFSEDDENHQNRSKLDPYWTRRDENQEF